ncbi:MAG: hypothetical protein UHO11_02080, partial [Treponema sp.]|nr:hypothetical protein [Treponema sp.]
GVFLKTGVSVATSATSTVATNAIQYAGDWDGFAASMSSFDTWSGVITSGAGSLISNSLNLATIGDNGVKVTGFSSMNISDMQNLNSVVGGLASSGLEYGLTGKTTLNVLNIADIGINSLVNRAIGNTAAPQVKASCGLLELHLDDSQGASFALGTGGTDLSIGTVASAARGLDALKTNFEINHFTNKNELQNAAIALREQYGFGGKAEKNQLKSILNGKTELKTGSGDGNAQTVRENGKRVVYLNNYSNDMTREEQIKLGITLGHEAYRDGVKGDELTQKIETRNAVAGHTDMMTRMLGDSMYAGTLSGIIAGDRNLQLDLIASSLGDDVFNDYVDNCYDSSADYWRMTWGGQLISDGDGWLKDMNGEFILDENGNKIGADKQESGLLNIMAGTGGQKYDSFSEEQKIQAQEIMNNAGLSMDKTGQWDTLSGKKLDMTQIMSISGDTIATSVFNQYYNNKVDYDLAGAWGLDLRFGETAMNKTVPDIAQERYSELVSTHLEETGSPAALMNKYTWTIYDSNGVATQLYKIDENNPFLDDLMGQHDFKGEKGSAEYTIDKWGCNFMSQLAVPQLLSGNIFSTDTILSIWNNSLSNGYVTGGIGKLAGNVNSPEGLANFSFTHANISNYGMSVGHSPWWNKIPYTSITNIMNVGGHFVLGNLNNSIIYNPGYNGSLPYKYYNEVMLYEK